MQTFLLKGVQVRRPFRLRSDRQRPSILVRRLHVNSNMRDAPLFSEGEDPAQISGDVAALQANGWVLSGDRKGIERRIQFKTFNKTWVG